MHSGRIGSLQIVQPVERLQSDFGHSIIGDPLAAHEHGMRQHAVAVAQDGFIPAPFIRTVRLIQSKQAVCQLIPDPVDQPVPFEPPKIFVNAEQGKGPGARTGDVEYGGQRLFEQSAGNPP